MSCAGDIILATGILQACGDKALSLVPPWLQAYVEHGAHHIPHNAMEFPLTCAGTGARRLPTRPSQGVI